MASLYLLGNPDHYASHKFVTVYWKNYVWEVFKSWKSEKDLQEIIPEGVEGEIVGFSIVDDYMYCPKLSECKTLYEWVQMSSRCKNPKSQKIKNLSSEDEYKIIEIEDKPQPKFKIKAKIYWLFRSWSRWLELNNRGWIIWYDNVDISEYEPSEFGSDTSFESEIKESYTGKAATMYTFLKDHSLYKTHKVKFDKQKKNTVPNFVGVKVIENIIVPACWHYLNHGDLENVWRKNINLLMNSINLTIQQTQYMKIFNLRYECNDAWDDFSAQLKKEIALEVYLISGCHQKILLT